MNAKIEEKTAPVLLLKKGIYTKAQETIEIDSYEFEETRVNHRRTAIEYANKFFEFNNSRDDTPKMCS